MPNKKINELSVRTPSLNDLMIVGDPSTGYSYKATINALTTFVGNNIQFSTLGGISLTSPSNGQVLQFNGTSWVNYTPTNWNTAYDRSLVSAGVSGTTTKTLTLTKQDGSTLTATWSDLNTDAVTSVFGRTGAVVAAEGDYSLTQLSDVTLSSPTTNQVLQYNGTGWVNGTISVPVTSIFGRTGNVVATEGDYTLTQLGDVTLTTPSSNQVLQYNGTAWVNATLTDNGITSLNGLTALTQTFAVGTGGTDFAIVSSTSTHTFNLPTASATNRGALSSADWSTFNAKQNAITLTTTGSSGSATLVGATLNIPTYTLSGLGGVSGSGTTNYLSKWTSSSALGNSLVFDNGTNVGIGVNSPSVELALYKASNPRFHIQNSTSGSTSSDGLQIALSGSDSYVWNWEAGFMAFATNNTERMRLFSNGNFAIGTTTDAGYRLDVSGTFRSTADAYFATSSGNVGIGTTSPSYKLDVSGDIRAESTVAGVFDGLRLRNPSTNTGNQTRIKFDNENAVSITSGGVIFFTGNAYSGFPQNSFGFWNYNSNGIIALATNATERMRVFANGNIGVNTTTDAGYKLDINGTARVQTSAYFATSSGAVGIGTSSPNASALLDVSSTTKGFLPPRMTNAQMTAIATPASGLMVYDTTNNKLNYYNGTSWVAL